MQYEEENAGDVHEGHRARLRERAAGEGLRNFQPHEVLELLLCESIPRRNVNPLAHDLIRKFGSLAGVLDASVEELRSAGLGEKAAAHLAYQREVFAFYQHDRWGKKPVLANVIDAGNYAASLFGRQREEQMFVICLDVHMRVVAAPLIAQGTIDSVELHPRAVLEQVLRHQARYIILTHNHPGGEPRPSKPDHDITQQMRQIMKMMDAELRDHIIVSGPNFYSIERDTLYEARELGEKDDSQLLRVRAEDYENVCYDYEPVTIDPAPQPVDLPKLLEQIRSGISPDNQPCSKEEPSVPSEE